MALQTYLPLYRKYRPQSFADVVGQEAIIQTLSNAINNQQVAHAYLFCGPRGTGKTSTARIFAKSLNCEQGPTTTPCQTCDSCLSVTAGNALDVIEFDAASNNSVDDARELIENCQFSPMQGKFKIYIIDEVHMLSTSAFNALLKTLEEPPEGVIFVFATTEAHKVLPTIISRCQRFDFSRIGLPELIQHLSHVSQQEQIQIDELATHAIARHSRGGLRDALSLLDQVGVLSRSQTDYVITPNDVARFLGSLTEDALIQVTKALQEQNVTLLTETLQGLLQHGIEPRQLLKSVTEHLRNLFLVASVCQQGGGALNDEQANALADQLAATPQHIQQLATLQNGFDISLYPQILAKLGEMDRHLRHSTNPHLWLEIGLVNLAYHKDLITIADLKQRLEAIESGNVQVATSSAAPAATPAQATTQTATRTASTQAQAPVLASATPAAPAPQSIPIPSEQPAHAAPSAPRSAMQAPQQQPQVTPAQPTPTQPAAPARPTPQASPQPAPLAAAGGGSHVGGLNWAQLVQSIPSPGVKALLNQHCQPIEVSPPNITIGCSSEAILNTLKQEGKFFHLQRALDSHFGQSINAQLTLHTTPAQAIQPVQPSPPSQNMPPSMVPAQTQAPPPQTNLQANLQESSQAAPAQQQVPQQPEPAMQTAPANQPAPQAVPMPSMPSYEDTELDMDEAKQYTAQLLQGSVIQPKSEEVNEEENSTEAAPQPEGTVAPPAQVEAPSV